MTQLNSEPVLLTTPAFISEATRPDNVEFAAPLRERNRHPIFAFIGDIATKIVGNKALWLALRIGISFLLVALILSKAKLGTFVKVLAHADPRLIALGMLVGIVTIWLSSWQWKLLLRYERINISMWLSFGLYFVGLTFGQLLPSSVGGDVAKAAYVARISKRGVGSASATLMARVVGLAALFITALPIGIIGSLVFAPQIRSLTLFLIAAAVGYVALLFFLLYSPIILQRIGTARFESSRIGRMLIELADTFTQYRQRPSLFASALGVSLIFYAFSSLNFYVFGRALHMQSPFWFYWVAIPVTSIVTMLPISLNGYGVRGASFVAAFLVMGESAAKSFSLALAMEVQMLIFALIGGVIVVAINRKLAASGEAAPAVATVAAQQVSTTPDLPTSADVAQAFAPKQPSRLPESQRPDRAASVLAFLKRHPNAVPVGLAALLFVSVLLPLGYQRLFKSTPHVALYTVQTQQLATIVGGGGLTYPAQSLDVSFPVSAQVLQVNVQVGQPVTAGQALITLDSSSLTAQLTQLESQYQAALDYLTTLEVQGAPGSRLALAEQQVVIAKSRLDTLNQQINSPTVNKGAITAPFNGVVSAINVSQGSISRVDLPLMTLQDDGTVIVRAQFPLQQLGQIQVGQGVDVEPDTSPNLVLPGKVTSINPTLKTAGSNSFEVWITVPNQNLQMLSGESVYARVHSTVTMPSVPELAVVNPNSDSIVFVYNNGRAHIRHVVVGARDGDRFGIVSGLQPGDQVILVGQNQLNDGEKVIVSSH